MNYSIFYPTNIEEVDKHNDNIDVCVEFENGKRYVFVVATPENLKTLMSNDGATYLKPGLPYLVAESITEENIKMLIDELLSGDERLLQIYGADL